MNLSLFSTLKNNDIFNSLSKGLQKNLVRIAVKEAAIFPDEPVTGDVHRLIRLPGSLHGGSGLRVTTIKSKELEHFNPMVSAVAFGEKPVKITHEARDNILSDPLGFVSD